MDTDAIRALAKWQALKRSVSDVESAKVRTWLAHLRTDHEEPQ